MSEKLYMPVCVHFMDDICSEIHTHESHANILTRTELYDIRKSQDENTRTTTQQYLHSLRGGRQVSVKIEISSWMPKPEELKLEVGKFYIAKNGWKCKVLYTRNGEDYSRYARVVIIWLHDEATDYIAKNGSYYEDRESDRDLIEECDEFDEVYD